MSKTIVCWAGHGGHDPGAVANGLQEKDLNLQIALELEKEMQNYNCNFIMGRKTDKFVSVANKAIFCDRNNSDLNIDIHCNAGGGVGFESFILTGLPSGGDTARIANIIHCKNATVFLRHGSRDRKLKRGDFHILQNTRAASWLPEYGFLDDRSGVDPRNLRNPAFISAVAEATAEGVAEALKLTRKSASTSPPHSPPPTLPAIQRTVTLKLNGKTLQNVTGYLINNRTYISVSAFTELAGVQVKGHGDYVDITMTK